MPENHNRSVITVLVLFHVVIGGCSSGEDQRSHLQSPPPATESIADVPPLLWKADRSPWLHDRKMSTGPMLDRNNADLLVLPVQGPSPTLDPIERSLVSHLIADRIARGGNVSVANPVAVYRYLGGHNSVIPVEDIREVARATNAKRVAGLYARYDSEGRWSMRAAILDPATGAELEAREWQDLPALATRLPHEQLESELPGILSFVAGQNIDVARQSASLGGDSPPFADDLKALIETSGESPLLAAAYLQVLADLYPRYGSRDERYQLYVRSLTLLDRLEANSEYRRFLRANALLKLGRRPAAVSLIDPSQNPHEAALLQYMNGNLPELQELTANSETSVFDFISLRNRQDLEWWYDHEIDLERLEAFADSYPAWFAFFDRQVNEYDGWASFSSAPIKENLELLVPTTGATLESDLVRRSVIGDMPSETDFTRLVLQHIRTADPDYSLQVGLEPATLDVFDLAKEIAAINHIREVKKDFELRRVASSALAEIEEQRSIFAGHPALTVLEGDVLYEMAGDAIGAERRVLLGRAAAARLNGLAWSTHLSEATVKTVHDYGRLVRQASAGSSNQMDTSSVPDLAPVANDWPRGPDWSLTFYGRSIHDNILEPCTEYLISSFQCVVHMIEYRAELSATPATPEEILERFANRYNGSPARSRFEVAMASQSGGKQDKISALHAQIDAGTTDWTLYHALAKTYVELGEYAQAQETWLAYPGFNAGKSMDLVGDSNNADIAAARLYWIGQHELARPLLEFAAMSGTGSGGAMSSAERLSLIDGELESAAHFAAERVRRYQSKFGMRDLIQIAHILGQHEVAWQVFDQALETDTNPQIFSGALVGHRMQSASTKDIADWQMEVSARNSSFAYRDDGGLLELGPRYLLHAATMDRIPEPTVLDSMQLMRSVPQPRVQRLILSPGSTETRAIESIVIANHSGEFASDRALATRPVRTSYEEQQTVPTRLESIAGAMIEFSVGDYEEAFWRFNEIAHMYTLEEYLPYYAYAAGRSEKLDGLLDSVTSEIARIVQEESAKPIDRQLIGAAFDHSLAKAVIAGSEGRHNDSLQILHDALNDRPFINNRTVYPMYMVVDLADRLYKDSGHSPYRDFALESSRRHTVVLPMYAWAYYVVAEFAKSQRERTQAAASAIALDPESVRRSRLPEKVEEDALRLLESSGAPYLRPRSNQVNSGI